MWFCHILELECRNTYPQIGVRPLGSKIAPKSAYLQHFSSDLCEVFAIAQYQRTAIRIVAEGNCLLAKFRDIGDLKIDKGVRQNG
ncbi:hypothetical protein A6E03_12785 [Aliivibrio sp. 1S128]|nr:hypothetical protein A6E03_12785 [Aliivibrio sp. 1S128]